MILAAAGVGFCWIESRTYTITADPRFKAEFGWPPDARIDWADLQARLDPESRGRLCIALEAAFSAATDPELLVRTAWPDGHAQWLALRGRALTEGGKTTRLVLTCRNASAERRAAADEVGERDAAVERERRLRTSAEAANRGKDQFLSVFSHELRSPLNAILGWNRILALKRCDDPQVTSITDRIENSARAQLRMVNDLLDLRRMETGKLHVELRPMQLAKVAAVAFDLARPAAAAKGIALMAEFDPGAGALRGDPDRLQQVVANLLSNAIKFTSSGGRIALMLQNVAGLTELRVTDTGHGIAPGLLPFVFDRFRQGDTSSTRHAGGLGLGLTLVREIVSLHGGSVGASSPGVGRGATFVVRLPTRQTGAVNEGQSPGDTATPSVRASLGGLSILVVDDELDARTVVAETLKLEGARVTVTDSAGAAFRKVQEAGAHFDIIVTDIGMPDEDGYSLVRRLRALHAGRQLLAIAVTGYASRSDVEAAMDAGFDLHVPKPVDFDTFVPLVRRLADGKGTGGADRPAAGTGRSC